MQRRLAFVIAVSLAFPVCAWADFQAEYQVTKQGGDVPALSRIEVGGGQMRMDAGKVGMLFDTSAGRVLVLQNDKRTYMDMQKIADTTSAAMAQANAALANLPPEQRAMIQQRMGAAMAGAGAKLEVSVTPTGASDRVAGYSCEVYRTDIGGRHREDTCLADVSAAGIPGADHATVRKAFEQMKALGEKMSAGMFHSPVNQLPPDKFPVRITHYDDAGNPTQVVELKSIAVSSVPSGDFAVPAGYTEQQIDTHGRR